MGLHICGDASHSSLCCDVICELQPALSERDWSHFAAVQLRGFCRPAAAWLTPGSLVAWLQDRP
eukprot:12412421-Karenia_brevis.AAC.1